MGTLPAPMTSSPLFLSYGMPKSGSTLAFELTRTMLELAGVPQDKLGGGVISTTADVNFVLELNGESFKALKEQTRSLAKPLVIKTHSKLFPRVKNALASGAVLGHAVCRDPRDIALSMLDAAREGRAWGTGPDGPFRTVADTEKRLHAGIRHFLAWAETPNVMPIHYERLAFDTAAVAGEIATQLGIETDLERVIGIVTREKFTQLNQGISQRWKTQMDPSDARRLEKQFADFIGRFCADVPQHPAPVMPKARFFTGWFRRG